MTDSTVFIRRPPQGPMGRIVRIAVIAVTAALVLASSFHAVIGNRDLSVLFALAAPVGLAGWGFARAGLHEAAVVLISLVMITVVTLALSISPLGVHDHAVIAYAGVLLFNALLLSRRRFVMMALLTIGAASLVFALEILGYTGSKLGRLTGWPALFDFLLISVLIGVLGRVVAEILFGSLGDAQAGNIKDPVTGLSNRARFLQTGAARLRSSDDDEVAVLVLADLDNFRRVNQVVGHQAADRILAEVSKRARAVAPGALFGRVGDDEIGVLEVGLAGEADATELARRLAAALSFEHDGVTVRASVGFAIAPRDARGIDSLLMAADASLAAAKKQ